MMYRQLIVPVVAALGIFLLGYYIYQKGEQSKEQEVLIQQQDDYINTTKRIQDAVKSNRNNDVDAAREWLRQRNQ